MVSKHVKKIKDTESFMAVHSPNPDPKQTLNLTPSLTLTHALTLLLLRTLTSSAWRTWEWEP